MKASNHIRLLMTVAALLMLAAFWAGCPSPKQAVIEKPVKELLKPVEEADAGMLDAGADAAVAEEQSGKIEDEEDKQVIPDAAKKEFNAGVAYMFADPDGAVAKFRQALAADPNIPKAYNNIGLILEWRGKFAEAEAEYNKALQVKADYYPAMLNIAKLKMRRGDLTGAENYLNEKLAKFKQSLQLRNKIAEIHLREGRVVDSMKESMDVLKTDEKNTGAMLNLAEGYFNQKKYELAQMVLDNAKEIEPGIAFIYVMEAYICLETRCKAIQNNQEAIASFKKALELRDDLPDVHNNLGYMYNEAGDFSNAMAEFRKALAYDPDFTKAQLNLANSLRGSRMYEEAEAEYKKVLASGKGGQEVLFDLGVLYLDMEREFKTGGDTMNRLKTAKEYLEKYSAGGRISEEESRRIADYLKEADKKIRQKEADLERENKRKLRDAEEKKKKEDEALKKQEELKKQQEEQLKKQAEEFQKQEAQKRAQEEALKQQQLDALKKQQEEELRRQQTQTPPVVTPPSPPPPVKESGAIGKPTEGEEAVKVLPSKAGSDKKIIEEPPKEAPEKATPPGGEGGKLESDEK
jgi:Tfp pilus assembly protein PilF